MMLQPQHRRTSTVASALMYARALGAEMKPSSSSVGVPSVRMISFSWSM